MKLFIFSDPHFGIYPTQGDRWLEMSTRWAYDFFLPLLRKYAKDGDRVLMLGDLYHNRDSINVKVLNRVVSIIRDIADVCPVDVLIGNHDCFNHSDTEITSSSSIRYVPNVTLYDEITEVQLGSKKAVYMPWTHSKSATLDALGQYEDKDLLFCHSDLSGCRTQVSPTRPPGRNIPTIDDFKRFKKVYSGHIHIRQTMGNFTFVGAPYHMDRNDIGNQKGVYVYDTEKDVDLFIPNDVSPEFVPITIDKAEDMALLTDELLSKNYVDLRVKSSLFANDDAFKRSLDKVLSRQRIETLEWLDDTVVKDLVLTDAETEEAQTGPGIRMNLRDLSTRWVTENTYVQDDQDADLAEKEGIAEIVGLAFDTYEKAHGTPSA